jgi:IS30 family transposase
MSRRSHVLTDKQIHAIRRLHALGASRTVIAAAVGVVEQTVSYHCNKPGKVVPADRRERQRGVKYKPRANKAEPVKTTSLEPVSLDEARQNLGMPAGAIQYVEPRRGLLSRLFGT